MRRKKRPEEHVNHDAWAIPYADLMTLLLAFFVVMYAVSVVNEGKFRMMSASIVQAFNGRSHVLAPTGANGDAMDVIPLGMRESAVLPPIDSLMPLIGVTKASQPDAATFKAPVAGADDQALAHIELEVRQALQPLIDNHLVTVRHGKNWLEIEIRTDILYSSGVAQLSTSAGRVLQQLASILAPFPNPLRVEGFTDNVPISTPMFPSNWELSAARAASVARLFAQFGVQPSRMGIVGWGDVKPVADNATADGRNRNRRVLVLVMANEATPEHSRTTVDQSALPPKLVAAGNPDEVLPTHYATVPTIPVRALDRVNPLSSALAAKTATPAVVTGDPSAHASAPAAPLATASQLRRPSEPRDNR